MLAAIKKGDTKKLAELMRQDPGFKVNMGQNGSGQTLLHSACNSDSSSAVIPLLLAHPDIDVNAKDKSGSTPFSSAIANAATSCVREMLKDSRVIVNERDKDGCTPPLWDVAANDRLDIIKWWIVSGREMILWTQKEWSRNFEEAEKEGEEEKKGETAETSLLKRFRNDASKTRNEVKMELGITGQSPFSSFIFQTLLKSLLLFRIPCDHPTKAHAGRVHCLSWLPSCASLRALLHRQQRQRGRGEGVSRE